MIYDRLFCQEKADTKPAVVDPKDAAGEPGEGDRTETPEMTPTEGEATPQVPVLTVDETPDAAPSPEMSVAEKPKERKVDKLSRQEKHHFLLSRIHLYHISYIILRISVYHIIAFFSVPFSEKKKRCRTASSFKLRLASTAWSRCIRSGWR